jgi:superfamily I DNA/RNA helicase
LVHNIGIDPASILVLAYSKEAVEELKERLNKHTIESVNIKTFHAL